MVFQSPGSVALAIGPVAIHWYGLMIALGVLAALFYATRELKRQGKSSDPLYDMGFWVILCGVIGARLYYVIFQWELYSAQPLEILQIWKGGLAIHGALIGGFLAFYAFCALKKFNWFMYGDILAPGVILAQAFGRWGNFFNNEAFGRPTSLPWKLFIPENFRPEGYEKFAYFHPTFFYESLWNLLGFFLLFYLARKFTKPDAKRHGFIFFSYLVFYSFGRFFIESIRTDSLMLGPMRIAQAVSIVLFIIGLVGIFRLQKTVKSS